MSGDWRGGGLEVKVAAEGFDVGFEGLAAGERRIRQKRRPDNDHKGLTPKNGISPYFHIIK